MIDLPGVLAYGKTVEEAITKVQALALRVLADNLENDASNTQLIDISFQAA